MTIANKFYKIMDAYGLDLAIEQGKAWYPNAWQFCRFAAKHHNVTPERVAAMVAVTSPRARWSKNTLAVAMLLEDMKVPEYKRQTYYGILPANARKGMLVANQRYYSHLVTGDKVWAFYRNILGHTDNVTVDSIMSRAAGYDSRVTDTIRWEVISNVRKVADVLGMTPRDTQAAIWCAYRGSAA